MGCHNHACVCFLVREHGRAYISRTYLSFGSCTALVLALLHAASQITFTAEMLSWLLPLLFAAAVFWIGLATWMNRSRRIMCRICDEEEDPPEACGEARRNTPTPSRDMSRISFETDMGS